MTSENAAVIDKSPAPTSAVELASIDAQEACVQSSPGEQLKAEREAQGLSLEQVAKQLHLVVAKVRYLENDEYEKLPSATFVLGYIRGYARLLKLSPDRLAKDYEDFIRRLEGTTKQLAHDPEPAISPRVNTVKRLLIPVSLVFLAVVAVLLFFLAQDDGDKPVTEPVSGGGTDQPIDVPSVPPTAAETLGGGSLSNSLDKSLPLPQTEGSTSGLSVSEQIGNKQNSSAPVVNALVPSTLSALKFVFSADCWVEVTDAAGKKIIAELKGVGDLAELTGEPPFDIVLGDARAAQVWIDGQPVALDISPNRKLLRLTLSKPALSDLPTTNSF